MSTPIDLSVGSLLDTALTDAVVRLLDYADEHRADHDFLEIERVNTLSAMDWCFNSQDWAKVIRFGAAIGSPARGFLGMRGYWDELALFSTRWVSSMLCEGMS